MDQMKVRPSERRYQLAAHKRNAEARKFDYYNETAKYFERECNKAKQFNTWNVDELKHTHWDNVKKAESLKLRQNKLQELVKNEEKEYAEECEKLKQQRTLKKEISLEEWKNQLKERRAELSLYNPRVSRRIQSYFLYPTQLERQPLKELNDSIKNGVNKQPTTSICNEVNPLNKYSDDVQTLRDDENSKPSSSPSSTSTQEQNDFYERTNAYRANRLKSQSTKFNHLYDDVQYADSIKTSNNNNNNNSNKLNYAKQFDRSNSSSKISSASTRRSNSNIIHGNQIYLSEENIINDNARNRKYKQRYSRRSLENTNVSETCMHSFDLFDDIQCKENNNIINQKILSNKIDIMDNDCTKNTNTNMSEENFDNGGKNKNPLTSSTPANVNEQEAVDNCTQAISIQSECVQNNDETKSVEKADEKNLLSSQFMESRHDRSEMMLIYLNYADIMTKIADLEKRERRACIKQQWEESLRLRDMKNRLELSRESQIYEQHNLVIDPGIKAQALKNIEIRSQQIKSRENVCSNSSMYSDEAKSKWESWIIEDEKSSINNYKNIRDNLLKQLEEEWQKLREEEKKCISEMRYNIVTGSSMQRELQLLAKKGFH